MMHLTVSSNEGQLMSREEQEFPVKFVFANILDVYFQRAGQDISHHDVSVISIGGPTTSVIKLTSSFESE